VEHLWKEVPEAWEVIETVVQPLGAEEVALEQAASRVLAEVVRVDRDSPAFDRAAMDGFAVRAAEVASARREAPVALQLAGESTPGSPYEGEAPAASALRIMTGAAVPPGWDSVVPVEETSGFEAQPVLVHTATLPGQNVTPRAGERRAGEDLLPPGRRLTAADIGALAMVGATRVRVGRRGRVAVLATGDEIVPHDTVPGPAQIRNSNSPMLAALAAPRARQVHLLGGAPDDPAALARAIRRGLEFDLLVLSGGMSMGAYDLVGTVLEAAGARFRFRRVALQPGKPVAFATHARGAVLALPGNPVSAFTTFRLFGRVLLACLEGDAEPRPRFVPASARFSWQRSNPRWLLLPGRRVEGGAGVERVPYAGSGDLMAYARADCQIVLPGDVQRVAPGEAVTVWPFDS